MHSLSDRLAQFAEEKHMHGKGPLCVALIVTEHGRDLGFPLNPDELLAESGGQVKGLGKAAVQRILARHGIRRVLAEEGGRTSRGSVGNMRTYLAFLNHLAREGPVDLDAIEAWWVNRVREYFAAQPLVLRFDASKSLRYLIRDILAQAERRQREATGMMFLGTVLQHLVGAKLDVLLDGQVEHRSASAADQSSGTTADFLVEDVAIHVTTSPGEALLRKCERNLASGLRPFIVTTGEGVTAAVVHAKALGIEDRVDLFEAEQFLAGNLYELGRFAETGRRATAAQIVERYNDITAEHETDPSFRIEVGE